MKKISAYLISFLALFISCTTSTNNNDNTDGYTIQVVIYNIPSTITNNQIIINVEEKTGTSTYLQTGQIVSTITKTTFSGTIKEYNSGSGITKNNKKYTNDVILSFDINIDTNNNSVMNDTGIDISDGINYQNISFSTQTSYAIDYMTLHIAGT